MGICGRYHLTLLESQISSGTLGHDLLEEAGDFIRVLCMGLHTYYYLLLLTTILPTRRRGLAQRLPPGEAVQLRGGRDPTTRGAAGALQGAGVFMCLCVCDAPYVGSLWVCRLGPL